MENGSTFHKHRIDNSLGLFLIMTNFRGTHRICRRERPTNASRGIVRISLFDSRRSCRDRRLAKGWPRREVILLLAKSLWGKKNNKKRYLTVAGRKWLLETQWGAYRTRRFVQSRRLGTLVKRFDLISLQARNWKKKYREVFGTVGKTIWIRTGS